MNRMLRETAAAALAVALVACASVASEPDAPGQSADAATANLQLGTAYLRKGNYAVAKEKLERARSQNPRDVDVLLALAILYQSINDPSKAESSYRNALRLEPNNPEVQNNYAVYLCRTGRVDEALKRFDLAARNKLYATPWAADTNAGVCLRSVKRDAEAEQHFVSALAENPTYAEAVLQQATLEYESKRLAAAWQRLVLYLNTNAANPALLYLGWRVATDSDDAGNAALMAKRLRTEFPQSSEVKLLAAGRPGAKSG